MCGIVAYFGGAGNHLTRVLTGMSAIIYRAPDSTGIGLLGDDREPIRLRKSLGSVVQLLDELQRRPAYSHADAFLHQVLSLDLEAGDLSRQQQELLGLEGFDGGVDDRKGPPPTFDALVDIQAAHPVRLAPGSAGPPLIPPEFCVRSREELSKLIPDLIDTFDLSPLVIHTLIRSALRRTLQQHGRQDAPLLREADILAAFDDVFEETRAGARIKTLRPPTLRRLKKPLDARKYLWQCLADTVIRIPADFNRDGVCCLFRLLDAALLSSMGGAPNLVEELDRMLDNLWPPSRRPFQVDWRALYAAEKSLNVYGWGGAAGLAYLRREAFLPATAGDTRPNGWMTAESVAPGRTDPMLLRYLVTPIIAHGRWAMQSAVAQKNAHPFTDARRQRAIVLNGQFDSRTEARLSTFLTTVGGYRLRSDNSSEYAALLWGHSFQQLSKDQRRSDLIRRQVDENVADIGIGSQSIDLNVYHQVRNRPLAELDRIALIAAVRRIVTGGGQVALAGISIESPRRLYVASHNRPVFIVRRMDNHDFMVVSDINAALGLFPQVLVEKTINALDALKERQAAAVAQMNGEGADREMVRTCTLAFTRERQALLDPFGVEVHPLEGEEIFAVIETRLQDGTVFRSVSISDFDGHPLPEVEPFKTHLDPVIVRKDLDVSFHESHLREVPERYRHILDIYSPDPDGGGPSIDLKRRVLRRRFDRRLTGLRRLIFVGTGSAFHMAAIARCLLAESVPDICIDVMRPGDIIDPKRMIQSQRALVVLLSWSSTTAEMVQLAQRLLADDILMIGITEKVFADMALTVRRSVGVMPIYSGEEVTVSGVKSTLCMLLCLNLLGAWICARKGLTTCCDTVVAHIKDLADRIEALNADANVMAFSRRIAADMVSADAIVAVSDPEVAGIGEEIALKLEEAGWYAVGQWRPYNDVLAADPKRWSTGRFVVIHATRRRHIDTAVKVMRRMAEAGVDFAVVTCPNRHQDLIDRLCRNRRLILPWADDHSQPYIDLAFYYRLALDFGLACGHDPGVSPRNRAKSFTVARSRSKVRLSPAAELKRMTAISAGGASSGLSSGEVDQCRWAAAVHSPETSEALSELCRLAQGLRADDPLLAMGTFTPGDTRELGRLIFDTRSEINDVVVVSSDPAAHSVVRDVVDAWRRLINIPIRLLLPGQCPGHTPDDALVLVAATRSPGGSAPSWDGLPNMAWIGPQPPSWLGVGKTTAGRYVLPSNGTACAPMRLYTGLNLLIAKAWAYMVPDKADVVLRHITDGAITIDGVLNDPDLLQGLGDVADANRQYRTAFFISPSAGAGRVWEDHFDDNGRLMVVYHAPGHAGYGPIVTIDSQAEAKYVAMESRAKMTARYGPAQVTRWESVYLDGRTVDDFLARDREVPLPRPRAPFYTNAQWYLPVLRPEYDTHRDNLIFLDMTAEYSLPYMLDELSLLGSRLPRLVVITQGQRLREIGPQTLFDFPISDLIVLPSLAGHPIPDAHLPFVLSAMGAALADIWRANPAQ